MTRQRFCSSIVSLAVAVSCIFNVQVVKAESVQNTLPPAESSPSLNDISKQLNELKQLLGELKKSDTGIDAESIAVVVASVAAGLIGGSIAILTAWSTNQAQKRLNHRQFILDSLDWFDEHTTGRGIGIAVLDASWDDNAEFHSIWISILVWQSSYLLSVATRKKESTEVMNLNNMFNLLRKAYLHEKCSDKRKEYIRRNIKQALQDRDDRGRGIELDPERDLRRWKKLSQGSVAKTQDACDAEEKST